MIFIWILILVSCIIIEISTVALVSIWFAVAAAFALGALALGTNAAIQTVIFVITSIIGMIIFKKIWKSRIKDKKIATNYDRYIGNSFTVVEEINNYSGKGAVSISGQIWSARNVNENEVIGKGSQVTLERIEGSMAYVRK